MAIILYSGLPGHGKTTALALQAERSLKFSQKLLDKHGIYRYIYTNLKFSEKFEDKYSHLIKYFFDIRPMVTWKDCDIFIDEMSLYFDAQQWEKLPLETKRYLRLHRHYDVNIYGAVQDFKTIDVTARRLTSRLYHSIKVFSTREPSPYLPAIRFPFSLNRVGEVKKAHWELEKEFYEYERYNFNLYTRGAFNIFDTRQEIPEQELPVIIKRWRDIQYVGGVKNGVVTGKYV